MPETKDKFFFQPMSKVEVKKLYTIAGHKDCVYVLEKGPEENSFFSSAGDGIVAKWDLDDIENGRMVVKVPSSIYALKYYAHRNVLIVGQNFEGIHLIDLGSKEEVGSIKTGQAAIFDIEVVKDRIIVALGDGEVQVFNLSTLKLEHRFKDSDKSARALTIHEELGHLSVAYSDNHIRVYDLANWKLLHKIEAHKISVFAVRYSPDGRYLLSGSRDAHLKVWDVFDRYELKESIVAHMYAINHIDYSADGKHFVTCSMDKSIKVWDAETFKLLKVIDKARHAGHGTSVNTLLWSNHNNLLISGSDDRSISIWDIAF